MHYRHVGKKYYKERERGREGAAAVATDVSSFSRGGCWELMGVCFACGKTNVDVQNGQMGLMEALSFLLVPLLFCGLKS